MLAFLDASVTVFPKYHFGKGKTMSPTPNMFDAEPIPEAAREEILKMLETGDLFRYTAAENSPVTLLEQEFADFIGSRYALAVASCSAALFLSLKALELPQDAKVLVPAFTFAAVPSAIVHANCVPVLVEVADNYRIDIADFEAKLTDDIQAIIISHMRGHTSDMDAIMKLADARGVPVIEDAAHSLGTLWNGKRIGTIGRIGCFSFQSYKLMNAGEGGILVTDDPDLIARAVIMSGAYEHNWKKHDVLQDAFAKWQNQLPLYNTRMSNISAAIIRPQIGQIPRRVADGRRNHDYVADALNKSPWILVPPALPAEERAPDSIQFNLTGMTDVQTQAFSQAAAQRGVKVQVFGMSADNARAFWNWEFLGPQPELSMTRAMLTRACDARLPARLGREDLDFVIEALVSAADDVMGAPLAYGT